MSQPARRHPLQQRVADVLVHAAARVFATRGEHASMNDVAVEAGVARATLYRYFPNRDALLDELARVAVTDAGAHLAASRVDEVPPVEGVRRTVRALADVGDFLFVLVRARTGSNPEQFEWTIAAPLARLFERGQASGEIRADVPASWLTDALLGLVVSILAARPRAGREDTIAAITTLFLEGASAHPVARP